MHIVIVGAGFSGIGMAIKLRQAGFTDITILEQAASVGGTWRDNTYPGCACDIMSHLYSFSFYQNPNWSASHGSWDEIQKYLEDCVDHFGIRPLIRFSTEVESCDYINDNTGGFQWSVKLKGNAEPLLCHFLVAASGSFSRISMPKFPQVNGGFRGPAFHTGRWDHSVSLEGKRVAVIGTGASAIQVIPELVKVAGQVKVFQRTPAWVLERNYVTYPEWQKKMYRYFPMMLWLSRFLIYMIHEVITSLVKYPSLFQHGEDLSKKLLEKQVADPQRRALLTPTYKFGCKRMLVSNTYYPAMASDKVTIVPDSIEAIAPNGVVTTGGQEHEVDVIVYATGFEVTDVSGMHPIVGRTGDDIRTLWKAKGQYAYLGTFVSGFPNMAFMLGPNSELTTNSAVFIIECQANMVVRLLNSMSRNGLRQIEVKKDVETKFNHRVQEALKGTIWLTGCRSWYINEQGRITTIWPFTTLRYWWESAMVGMGTFVVTP
jgi:cation diffusion facilitator CzcD-associated flavoprotein CzcO